MRHFAFLMGFQLCMDAWYLTKEASTTYPGAVWERGCYRYGNWCKAPILIRQKNSKKDTFMENWCKNNWFLVYSLSEMRKIWQIFVKRYFWDIPSPHPWSWNLDFRFVKWLATSLLPTFNDHFLLFLLFLLR